MLDDEKWPARPSYCQLQKASRGTIKVISWHRVLRYRAPPSQLFLEDHDNSRDSPLTILSCPWIDFGHTLWVFCHRCFIYVLPQVPLQVLQTRWNTPWKWHGRLRDSWQWYWQYSNTCYNNPAIQLQRYFWKLLTPSQIYFISASYYILLLHLWCICRSKLCY